MSCCPRKDLHTKRNVPDGVTLGTRAGRHPERQDVLVLADGKNDAIDLLADPFLFAADALADERIYHLFPHAICDALAQAQNPTSASDVRGVLPCGCDGRAEDVVVANDVGRRWRRVGRVGGEDCVRRVRGTRKRGRGYEVGEEWVEGLDLRGRMRSASQRGE